MDKSQGSHSYVESQQIERNMEKMKEQNKSLHRQIFELEKQLNLILSENQHKSAHKKENEDRIAKKYSRELEEQQTYLKKLKEQLYYLKSANIKTNAVHINQEEDDLALLIKERDQLLDQKKVIKSHLNDKNHILNKNAPLKNEKKQLESEYQSVKKENRQQSAKIVEIQRQLRKYHLNLQSHKSMKLQMEKLTYASPEQLKAQLEKTEFEKNSMKMQISKIQADWKPKIQAQGTHYFQLLSQSKNLKTSVDNLQKQIGIYKIRTKSLREEGQILNDRSRLSKMSVSVSSKNDELQKLTEKDKFLKKELDLLKVKRRQSQTFSRPKSYVDYGSKLKKEGHTQDRLRTSELKVQSGRNSDGKKYQNSVKIVEVLKERQYKVQEAKNQSLNNAVKRQKNFKNMKSQLSVKGEVDSQAKKLTDQKQVNIKLTTSEENKQKINSPPNFNACLNKKVKTNNQQLISKKGALKDKVQQNKRDENSAQAMKETSGLKKQSDSSGRKIEELVGFGKKSSERGQKSSFQDSKKSRDKANFQEKVKSILKNKQTVLKKQIHENKLKSFQSNVDAKEGSFRQNQNQISSSKSNISNSQNTESNKKLKEQNSQKISNQKDQAKKSSTNKPKDKGQKELKQSITIIAQSDKVANKNQQGKKTQIFTDSAGKKSEQKVQKKPTYDIFVENHTKSMKSSQKMSHNLNPNQKQQSIKPSFEPEPKKQQQSIPEVEQSSQVRVVLRKRKVDIQTSEVGV